MERKSPFETYVIPEDFHVEWPREEHERPFFRHNIDHHCMLADNLNLIQAQGKAGLDHLKIALEEQGAIAEEPQSTFGEPKLFSGHEGYPGQSHVFWNMVVAWGALKVRIDAHCQDFTRPHSHIFYFDEEEPYSGQLAFTMNFNSASVATDKEVIENYIHIMMRALHELKEKTGTVTKAARPIK